MERYRKALMQLLVLGLGMGFGLSALSAQADEIELEITDETFGCIRDMTPVRGFFVSNLVGDLDATLEVAHSETGGTYPTGSVVQLVPTEVMVKHPEGTSPATNDWEFFELVVSDEENRIGTRGYADVVNRFGGNCFGCHIKADPQRDMICESGHGCDPIPLSNLLISAIQKTDPRCDEQPVLSEEEQQALRAMMGDS